MTGWILIALPIAFYYFIYRKWKSSRKLTFKIVTVCITSFFFLLALIACIGTIREAYDNERWHSVANRQRMITYSVNRGKYADVIDEMNLYQSYEPEFDALWERALMYESCNRYLVYDRACETDSKWNLKAEECEELLHNVCDNPKYEENREYGKYFLKKAGL